MNYKILMRKMDEALAEAQKLLDKAIKEDRDLSGEERKEYDKLRSEASLYKEQAEIEGLRDGRNINTGQIQPQMGELQANNGPIVIDNPFQEGDVRFLRHADPIAQRAQEYDHTKMFRGLVTGDWKGAESERRALQEAEDPLGGYLLPAPMSDQFIDLARARMVTSQAGAITIPMEADSITVPKLNADPTVYWRKELEEITESELSFAAITLKAKSAACLITLSQELYDDAEGVGNAVEKALSAALAVEMDRVVLVGSGQNNEPLGIYNQADVPEIDMGTNGAAFTNYDKHLEAVEKIETNNGGCTHYIIAPRTKKELATLKTGISGDETTLKPPPDVESLRRLVTTGVPIDQEWGTASDASSAFFGGFNNVYVGVRNAVRIDVSPHGSGIFNKLAVWIRAFIRMDVAIVRTDHLTVIKGIIPA